MAWHGMGMFSWASMVPCPTSCMEILSSAASKHYAGQRPSSGLLPCTAAAQLPLYALHARAVRSRGSPCRAAATWRRACAGPRACSH